LPIGQVAAQGLGEEGGAQAVPDTVRVQTPQDLKNTMATVGLNEVPGLKEWERQKSAKVAVLSSMVLPGLGQAYNGRKWKAAIFGGLFTFYAGTAWVEYKKSEDYLNLRDGLPAGSLPWEEVDRFYQFHKENAKDFMWWAGAVWFFGLLDAFVDAHLYDVRAVDPAIFKSSGGQKYLGLSYGL
jgi:hypothetical protein